MAECLDIPLAQKSGRESIGLGKSLQATVKKVAELAEIPGIFRSLTNAGMLFCRGQLPDSLGDLCDWSRTNRDEGH